jgi:signal transduction histidine kinase
MPLQLLLLAFVKVSFFGHADAPSSILILFALGFVHELVAIMDYRRVLENLRAAQLALAAANEQNVRLLEQRQIAAAEVAHDMGNALQNIWLTITKLKQVIPADVARAQGLDAAEAAMAFCEDLLTALVAAAQLDAGALQLSLKPTDLKALVSRILRQLTPHAFLGGVQIQFHPAPILPLSYCDAHLVARALANIINNAIKYTAAARPGSGQVIIQITPVGGQLQITVLDNGPGMTSADQARIGQRFIRGATAIGAPAGFGLGLTFARGVIEQHPQGEFAIKAQIGGGTCVTMMLAMAEALEE